MSACHLDGLEEGLFLPSGLAQVHKHVQHPESIVVLADVKATLVEFVDSSVVAIESGERNVGVEHGRDLVLVIGLERGANNLFNFASHPLSVLQYCIKLF